MNNEIASINGLVGCVSILETCDPCTLSKVNDLLYNRYKPSEIFKNLYCDEIPETSEHTYIDFGEPITLLSDISITIANEC